MKSPANFVIIYLMKRKRRNDIEIIIAAAICIAAVIIAIAVMRRQFKSVTDTAKAIGSMTAQLGDTTARLADKVSALDAANTARLDGLRDSVDSRLAYIQRDTDKRLDNIESIVKNQLHTELDEKLTRSFGAMNTQLKGVYENIGEIKTLASDVSDLRKVLANVKTRGILGEVQLGSILAEIMPHEQYEENVAVIPSSRNVVEYALRLPADDDKVLYLPIDAKFPLDAYYTLQSAYEEGDKEKVDAAAKTLIARLRSFAKDISEKYIKPPYTTDFAVMFLPLEGLYAEAVNRGMIETLQREFKVSITGPSTMAAFIQSLEVGFKTLAVEKRSAEVWETLSGVKDEFDKFESMLETARRHIAQADEDLDKLIGVRTRAIQRKLKDVSKN